MRIKQYEYLRPWFVMLAAVTMAVILCRWEGRVWWCACGRLNLWSSDIWSLHCSQHFLDPYSFTHVLHGVVFYGLLAWLCPKLSFAQRLSLAVCIEGGWEIFENCDFTIQRYREMTLAVGYQGDAIFNSVGDILCCSVGFILARRLGFWGSVVLFLATEAILVVSIRDCLLLNIIMLIHPIEAIKSWQIG